jgi:phage tail-like protein
MAGTADPITASRFSIVIDGYPIAAFTELKGITTEVKPVEHLESTEKELVLRKLPGTPSPATIELVRGKTADMALWAWHEAVLQGDILAARKSCSLVMYGPDGKPVARYHMQNAWPSMVKVGAMKAGDNTVLTETVTIVCEMLQRVSV